MTQCRSCGAEIIWALSAASGKALPVDAEPVPNGNLRLSNGTATVLVTDPEGDPEPRYVSHFATCPQAGSWRKR